MSAKFPRMSSVKHSSSAPVAWAAVLALVTAACGGGVDDGTSTGGSSGPSYPADHPCAKSSCGRYLELPDGTTVAVPADGGTPDGGTPDGGTLKACFCGNG